MVFILSKLYSKIPKNIKNNPYIIKSVQRFNNNNRFREINSHYQMLDLLFTNFEVKANGTLRKIQLLELELLVLFDKICAKHDIEYWIDYGTYLGAVRHKGFVPWDDDIDIGMKREDYERFLEIFPEEIEKIDELKDNLIVSRMIEPHKNYPENCNELDKKNKGTFILFFQCALKKPFVHFDVFPRDFIKDEGLTKDRNQKQIILHQEFVRKIERNEWTFDEGLKIQQERMNFTREETKHLSDALDGLHNNIHNRIYDTSYIFPLDKICFEGQYFSCPRNSQSYLPIIYGPEYMHIPRIINNHNTIDFVRSQYDNDLRLMNEDFDEKINLLKKINANFK